MTLALSPRNELVSKSGNWLAMFTPASGLHFVTSTVNPSATVYVASREAAITTAATYANHEMVS